MGLFRSTEIRKAMTTTYRLRQLESSLEGALARLTRIAERAEDCGWPSDNAVRETIRRLGVFRLAVSSLADKHRDPRGRHRRAQIGNGSQS